MFQTVQQNMMQTLTIFEDDLITQETVHYIILSEKGCLLNCIYCIIPSFITMTSMSSSMSSVKNVNRQSLDHMPWKVHQSEPLFRLDGSSVIDFTNWTFI